MPRGHGQDYDKAGNRTRLTSDGEITTLSQYYQNNAYGNLSWLRTDGTWFYEYDNNGNQIVKAKRLLGTDNTSTIDTSKEYWNYTWDLRNRLTSVSKNGVTVASYTYDADNFRVKRVSPTDTTVYAYGRNGALTYQKSLTTNTSRTFTYLQDQVVGWTDTAANGTKTTYYAVTDQLGSVTQVMDAGQKNPSGALVDGSAKIVWASEYDPFGKTAGVEGLYDFDGSYAGHQVDRDTGLIYMWNRWQDPDNGRFISEDPARDGSNWYGYASNNPVNRWDPTGLYDWSRPAWDQPIPDPQPVPAQQTQSPDTTKTTGVPQTTSGYENGLETTNGGTSGGSAPVDNPAPANNGDNGGGGSKPKAVVTAPTPMTIAVHTTRGFGPDLSLRLMFGAFVEYTRVKESLTTFTITAPRTRRDPFDLAIPRHVSELELFSENARDAGLMGLSLLGMFEGFPMLPPPTAGAMVLARPTAGNLSLGLLSAGPLGIQNFNLMSGEGPAAGNAADPLAEAGKVIDKGDLTKAGRALEKHGSRQGSVFPQATGNSAAKNEQGQKVLEEILGSTDKTIKPNRFGGQDIFDNTTGRGVRYDDKRNMMGFLEP